MSCCPGHCGTCSMEIKQEHHQCQAEAHHLCSCHTGSMPTVEEIFEDLTNMCLDGPGVDWVDKAKGCAAFLDWETEV